MGHFECGVDVLEWGVGKMGLFQRRITKPISSYVIILVGGMLIKTWCHALSVSHSY